MGAPQLSESEETADMDSGNWDVRGRVGTVHASSRLFQLRTKTVFPVANRPFMRSGT